MGLGANFCFPWLPFLAFLSPLDFLFDFVYYPLEIVATAKHPLTFYPGGDICPKEKMPLGLIRDIFMTLMKIKNMGLFPGLLTLTG